MPTNKTVDMANLEIHIRYVTEHQGALKDFYGRQRFKNLKFLR
jgi:hypothetical protein